MTGRVIKSIYVSPAAIMLIKHQATDHHKLPIN